MKKQKKYKDVYFPNEVQRDTEQGDFKMKNQMSEKLSTGFRCDAQC